jgi:hypothetical protein
MIYLLPLRGDTVQSAPCTAAIFWTNVCPHLSSNNSWFIHQSCLKNYQQRHLVAKQGESYRECPLILSKKYLCHTPQGSLNSVNSDMEPTALLFLRRKSYYGFLSPLKIHRPQLGLNPLTSDPMASTITTRPPRTTGNHGYLRNPRLLR